MQTQQNMFACGANVRLINSAGLPSAALQAAINIWNGGVLNSYGLPHLSLTGVPGDPTITFTTSGSGQYACGLTDIQTRTVTIYRSTATNNCVNSWFRVVLYSNTTELGKLVAHEVGHALGFDGHFVVGQPVYGNQHVRHCINVVPPNYPDAFNNSVCEHERQMIYWAYGLHPNPVDRAKDFVIGLEVDPTGLSLDLNANGTVSILGLALSGQTIPFGTVIAPTPTDQFVWAYTNVTPPSAFSLSGTSGTSTTVLGSGTAGTATLQADLMVNNSYNMLWPFNSGEFNGRTSVATTPPAGPPSALIVSGITSSTATFGWTYGDGAATTVVQYRLNGTGPFTTAGTAAAGQTSFPISGLTSCSLYDANLYHVRNTLSSTNYTTLGAFYTPAAGGACAPSNFQVQNCHTYLGNKGFTYRTFYVSWTRGEFSIHSTYEIAQNSVNNPATATIIRSGGSEITTDSLGGYIATGSPYYYYFWVRHKLSDGTPSSWAALADNPLNPTMAC